MSGGDHVGPAGTAISLQALLARLLADQLPAFYTELDAVYNGRLQLSMRQEGLAQLVSAASQVPLDGSQQLLAMARLLAVAVRAEGQPSAGSSSQAESTFTLLAAAISLLERTTSAGRVLLDSDEEPPVAQLADCIGLLCNTAQHVYAAFASTPGLRDARLPLRAIEALVAAVRLPVRGFTLPCLRSAVCALLECITGDLAASAHFCTLPDSASLLEAVPLACGDPLLQQLLLELSWHLFRIGELQKLPVWLSLNPIFAPYSGDDPDVGWPSGNADVLGVLISLRRLNWRHRRLPTSVLWAPLEQFQFFSGGAPLLGGVATMWAALAQNSLLLYDASRGRVITDLQYATITARKCRSDVLELSLGALPSQLCHNGEGSLVLTFPKGGVDYMREQFRHLEAALRIQPRSSVFSMRIPAPSTRAPFAPSALLGGTAPALPPPAAAAVSGGTGGSAAIALAAAACAAAAPAAAAVAPAAAAPADAGQQPEQVSAHPSVRAAPQPPALLLTWVGSETQDNLPPPAPGRVLASPVAAAPVPPPGRSAPQQWPRLPPLVPVGLGGGMPSRLAPPSQQGPLLGMPASQRPAAGGAAAGCQVPAVPASTFKSFLYECTGTAGLDVPQFDSGRQTPSFMQDDFDTQAEVAVPLLPAASSPTPGGMAAAGAAAAGEAAAGVAAGAQVPLPDLLGHHPIQERGVPAGRGTVAASEGGGGSAATVCKEAPGRKRRKVAVVEQETAGRTIPGASEGGQDQQPAGAGGAAPRAPAPPPRPAQPQRQAARQAGAHAGATAAPGAPGNRAGSATAAAQGAGQGGRLPVYMVESFPQQLDEVDDAGMLKRAADSFLDRLSDLHSDWQAAARIGGDSTSFVVGGRTYHSVSTASGNQAAVVSALRLGDNKVPGRQLVGALNASQVKVYETNQTPVRDHITCQCVYQDPAQDEPLMLDSVSGPLHHSHNKCRHWVLDTNLASSYVGSSEDAQKDYGAALNEMAGREGRLFTLVAVMGRNGAAPRLFAARCVVKKSEKMESVNAVELPLKLK